MDKLFSFFISFFGLVSTAAERTSSFFQKEETQESIKKGYAKTKENTSKFFNISKTVFSNIFSKIKK